MRQRTDAYLEMTLNAISHLDATYSARRGLQKTCKQNSVLYWSLVNHASSNGSYVINLVQVGVEGMDWIFRRVCLPHLCYYYKFDGGKQNVIKQAKLTTKYHFKHFVPTTVIVIA